MDLDTELILDEACLTLRGLLAEVYALLISKNGFVDRAGLTIYLCVQQKKKQRSKKEVEIVDVSGIFPFSNVPLIHQHVEAPYSDRQRSQSSRIKLPCHMSRPVWFGWNSSTAESWAEGHMLSLPIHQFTSTPITVEGGELYKKGQGGRKVDPGWQEGGHVTRRVQPLHADLTDLQVLKWKWCDCVATCRHKHNMQDWLVHTWEHRNVQNVPFRHL